MQICPPRLAFARSFVCGGVSIDAFPYFPPSRFGCVEGEEERVVEEIRLRFCDSEPEVVGPLWRSDQGRPPLDLMEYELDRLFYLFQIAKTRSFFPRWLQICVLSRDFCMFWFDPVMALLLRSWFLLFILICLSRLCSCLSLRGSGDLLRICIRSIAAILVSQICENNMVLYASHAPMKMLSLGMSPFVESKNFRFL